MAELHRNQTLWLVDLLRHLTADRFSWECPLQQEADTERDKELRLLEAHKLQHQAEELVVKTARLSSSIFRSRQGFSVSPKGVFSRKKNRWCAERLITTTVPISLVVCGSFPRSYIGLTGICREPNRTGIPQENGSACFIPSAAIKHARVCDCVGSAHTAEDDLKRM